MTALNYSFIIPVYNRPEEIGEFLESAAQLEGQIPFEIVIVEDGSSLSSEAVVADFKARLQISYYQKQNSGPGDSRNYGMQRAKGNYFIIFDSDCILPAAYLKRVDEALQTDYVDCYGGPDAAHPSFSNLQKAINFSMTSVMTTGGIRGKGVDAEKFQPRSFNMGISKEAFLASGGFTNIHPGEDPDLSIRLSGLGYKTRLLPDAFVYHKRRISWRKFYQQVHKFGLVRPILNSWHPKTARIVYWFPTLFIAGLMLALMAALAGLPQLLVPFYVYFGIAFVMAFFETKSLTIAFQSLIAILIQFYGYGTGFLKSFIYINLLNKNPETQFPQLFFKHVK